MVWKSCGIYEQVPKEVSPDALWVYKESVFLGNTIFSKEEFPKPKLIPNVLMLVVVYQRLLWYCLTDVIPEDLRNFHFKDKIFDKSVGRCVVSFGLYLQTGARILIIFSPKTVIILLTPCPLLL
eukprot:TRINITY_DN2293_c0_g2_i5.p1 TRINITY_DN2293_c0_g2~~TRINITY_DN2293_c0_g2_i5.p1  ORF type:complete len:124 (+),score=17.50 TRINITY_DN2293_c0_g2_i5:343-714(+)